METTKLKPVAMSSHTFHRLFPLEFFAVFCVLSFLTVSTGVDALDESEEERKVEPIPFFMSAIFVSISLSLSIVFSIVCCTCFGRKRENVQPQTTATGSSDRTELHEVTTFSIQNETTGQRRVESNGPQSRTSIEAFAPKEHKHFDVPTKDDFGMLQRNELHSNDKSNTTGTIKDGLEAVTLQGDEEYGLGFTIEGSADDGIFVEDVMPTGPANESQRIDKGDRIVRLVINLENMTVEQAESILEVGSFFPVELHLLKCSPGVVGHANPGIESAVDRLKSPLKERGKSRSISCLPSNDDNDQLMRTTKMNQDRPSSSFNQLPISSEMSSRWRYENQLNVADDDVPRTERRFKKEETDANNHDANAEADAASDDDDDDDEEEEQKQEQEQEDDVENDENIRRFIVRKVSTEMILFSTDALSSSHDFNAGPSNGQTNWSKVNTEAGNDVDLKAQVSDHYVTRDTDSTGINEEKKQDFSVFGSDYLRRGLDVRDLNQGSDVNIETDSKTKLEYPKIEEDRRTAQKTTSASVMINEMKAIPYDDKKPFAQWNDTDVERAKLTSDLDAEADKDEHDGSRISGDLNSDDDDGVVQFQTYDIRNSQTEMDNYFRPIAEIGLPCKAVNLEMINVDMEKEEKTEEDEEEEEEEEEKEEHIQTKLSKEPDIKSAMKSKWEIPANEIIEKETEGVVDAAEAVAEVSRVLDPVYKQPVTDGAAEESGIEKSPTQSYQTKDSKSKTSTIGDRIKGLFTQKKGDKGKSKIHNSAEQNRKLLLRIPTGPIPAELSATEIEIEESSIMSPASPTHCERSAETSLTEADQTTFTESNDSFVSDDEHGAIKMNTGEEESWAKEVIENGLSIDSEHISLPQSSSSPLHGNRKDEHRLDGNESNVVEENEKNDEEEKDSEEKVRRRNNNNNRNRNESRDDDDEQGNERRGSKADNSGFIFDANDFEEFYYGMAFYGKNNSENKTQEHEQEQEQESLQIVHDPSATTHGINGNTNNNNSISIKTYSSSAQQVAPGTRGADLHPMVESSDAADDTSRSLTEHPDSRPTSNYLNHSHETTDQRPSSIADQKTAKAATENSSTSNRFDAFEFFDMNKLSLDPLELPWDSLGFNDSRSQENGHVSNNDGGKAEEIGTVQSGNKYEDRNNNVLLESSDA